MKVKTKKYKYVILFLLLVINLTYLISANKIKALELKSSAKGMCVINAETNRVVYSKNSNSKLPMASTTKIVTAIVALENMKDINEKVKVDNSAVGIEGTSIYLRKGEVLTLNELLLGLILASGNDCAVAIACHIGGSEENFVQMMNDFALKVGAINTHFDNPHGLDSENHYTTAYDLALITSYASRNNQFLNLVGTKRAKISGNDEIDFRYLKNKDKLLFKQKGCLGGKTGFTDNALRCLVNICKRDDATIICVVLNCSNMFEEADRLTNLAFENYKLEEFIKPYNFVGNVEVLDGEKNSTNLVTIKGYREFINKNEINNYEVCYDIPKSINAPIEKGQVVGKVYVKNNNDVVFEENICTIENIKNTNLKHFLDNIINNWYNKE